MRIRSRLASLSLILFTAVFIQGAAADESLKSRYFNVDIDGGIGMVELLERLNASYFLRMKTAFPDASEASRAGADAMLRDVLDAMYLEISDILDIHMYSFSIDLEIVRDEGRLAEVLKGYTGSEVKTPSFYMYDKNRIFISYADLTAGMLSHEIAHAIVSHYFVVPPPERVQEVLSGYVEYSIRKHTAKS